MHKLWQSLVLHPQDLLKELEAAKIKFDELAEVLPLKETKEKVSKVIAWVTVWDERETAERATHHIEVLGPKKEAEVIFQAFNSCNVYAGLTYLWTYGRPDVNFFWYFPDIRDEVD